MQNHSITKVSEKQQVKEIENKNLRVAVYCRFGSADQLSDVTNMQVQKGGGRYNAKP